MDWALAIGAGGLALGVINLITWWIERRDRKAEVAEERKAREEALAIERKRLDAELQDRERAQRADINPTQGGFEGDGLDRRFYKFILRNMGPSYSKYVSAWLVDPNGTPRSSRPEGFPLEVGEEKEIALSVSREVWDPPQPVQLMLAWRDSNAVYHEEPSNLTVKLT